MMEGNSPVMTLEETMIASRGMYIRNIAYIPPNWKDIRIADINELGDIAKKDLEKRKEEQIMSKKRNYYRYELRDGRKIVYIGVTDDPSRREREHKSEGKRFTSMNIVGPAVTKGSAEQWEEKRLEQYCRSHGGKSPKYNKTEG